MSDSFARNQNQLSEQLQLLNLLRRRFKASSDRSLGYLAGHADRRGRLAVQDGETLALQLVSLCLVGQTRGDTAAVALDKRDLAGSTFLLAMNRRHTEADEERACRFFEVAASTTKEHDLLIFAMEHSTRKINRRLVKLKSSIAQCMPLFKHLIHGYNWPRDDLRRRARELLPAMQARFGEVPLPKLYVSVLNALAKAITPSRPYSDSPTHDDYDHFHSILEMSTFILSTRFVSWAVQVHKSSEALTLLERQLYRIAQYLMGTTAFLEMRPTLPWTTPALPYVWATLKGEPLTVEDLFLMRTPLEVARELDARWTESELRARRAKLDQWAPFSNPRIHAELRLIAFTKKDRLDPSFDTYDPRKPAAVRIGSSHDICTLCALWVSVHNRHFGTRFKVFPMGGSGKMDRNWAYVVSPRERPDQDVSELVYTLLEQELEDLRYPPHTSWRPLLKSLWPWMCLAHPDESVDERRGLTSSSTHTQVATHINISEAKVADSVPPSSPLSVVGTWNVDTSRKVVASAKYDAIRQGPTADAEHRSSIVDQPRLMEGERPRFEDWADRARWEGEE
ncbi:hypothetical protein BC834DRAFT_967425 [Gloeopeniophorella convolvens]|nr:hypothetical protein BC834DRAFT_967425 [Gloeopeniophorella convolvens]